ncbi:hypothetical protein AKJ09_00236 [Labilithrix luteola]|uniref:GPI inositol-deacylase PGAP1-like alpha/beta domain-containing protein n=1 Tax=Labilithrix luteola TaxID=1391654 RepID=A0A0K1PJ77_9BACT|nr:alpha/beta hydrolase [Labilithrix luteola]AKU93572.1 hypothetical protein AKJ09_00236 [Labilithrix luteola]
MATRRNHADDLRGVTKLAIEAVTGVTQAVAEMHETIASGPPILGRPLERPARLLTKLLYAPMRGVTNLVGESLDFALERLGAVLGESVPGVERDAVQAALNGVLGDYLEQSKNPLAISMELRAGGHTLTLEREALSEALPEATGKILVLVHGSSMSDRGWNRLGHDHGAALARDLGYTPIYVRYNSGLHVSTNGRALSAMLESLVKAWPVPIDEITLLAHSMGGLVARSACHVATLENHAWVDQLRNLVSLGTPHHGAPLERAGNLFEVLLGISAYSAPIAKLGRLRSAGVTDLRHGNVLDEDWLDQPRFELGADPRRGLALPARVSCFAIAGTAATEMREQLPGDGLVPVASALGRHAERALHFPAEHQWIALGTNHIDLLSSPVVYEKIRDWLAADRDRG